MEAEKIYLLAPIIIFMFYLMVMVRITFGWFRLPFIETGREAIIKVSSLISARNEEQNIIKCLESITAQDYPAHLIQIVVADDASEDQTTKIVEDFASKNPSINLKLLRLAEHGGKKTALTQALKQATGDFILTTDADCTAGRQWISYMVAAFKQQKAVFVSGPVDLKFNSPVADLLPGLEFMSLIASGAGAIGAGFPIMCNGANMGFSLEHYRQLPQDALQLQEASGDDVFLMQSFKKHFGKQRIGFARNSEAVVSTSPPTSIYAFFRQRLRWTSKSRAYGDLPTILIAFAVLLINMVLAIGVILSFLYTDLILPTLILIGLKTLADMPLLWSYAIFSKKLYRIALLPLAEPLVAFYITFTGIAGQFVNVQWKGRKIRNA